MRIPDIHARYIKTCHTAHGTAQFAHQAHNKSLITHAAQCTAPPSALPSQQHCLRTSCPTRAAPVSLSAHMHCHTTPLLRHRLHAGARPKRKAHTCALAGVHRCDRHAAHSLRTLTAARPGPSPPRSRRDPGALARRQRCACPTAGRDCGRRQSRCCCDCCRHNCCMHTAQPARDRQGARDTRHARGQLRTRSR